VLLIAIEVFGAGDLRMVWRKEKMYLMVAVTIMRSLAVISDTKHSFTVSVSTSVCLMQP
jgi:hypothetical protein